jgi:hypothetical protein
MDVDEKTDVQVRYGTDESFEVGFGDAGDEYNGLRRIEGVDVSSENESTQLRIAFTFEGKHFRVFLNPYPETD